MAEGPAPRPRGPLGGSGGRGAALGGSCAAATHSWRRIPRAGREPRASAPPGDALLALWKVQRKQLKNIITVVVKCSLEIHQLFAALGSEGLDVRVKIGEPRRREGGGGDSWAHRQGAHAPGG